MARRGRFHVLPADDTYPIEDFDMFKTKPKAKEPRRVSQHNSTETTSAVHRVFNTTELVEMILLDDNLRSQKLQIKMFGLLACTSQNAKMSFKEASERSTGGDEMALFNLMMGISRADSRLQLPLFRHFNFRLKWEHKKEGTQLCLRSIDPLTGTVEKRLRPHLGGSWRKMAIAKIPLTLRVQVDSQYLERLSLNDEDAVMGKLVDILSTWYSDKYQRREHRYKTVQAPRYRPGLTLLID